jgi:hypothetical protein
MKIRPFPTLPAPRPTQPRRAPSRKTRAAVVIALAVLGLTACGGDGGYYYYGNGDGELVSFVGTSNAFVAWADPTTGVASTLQTGTYAGKAQFLRGTIDPLSGRDWGQPAGVEVYKGADGHIHALQLTARGAPVVEQLSNESGATIDDTCSLSGPTVSGANTDYAGVYFAGDLANPVNSTYFYRLPGTDGVCNTADDVVRMVKTGMSAGDAPVTVSAMPVATVRGSNGSITGFVIKQGASLLLVDSQFNNPVTLGTFAAPITVAYPLPAGLTAGYPTSQWFVVDGAVYHVDYAAHTTSAAQFSLPNWSATDPVLDTAASPTSLYFAVNTPAAGSAPASASVYEAPQDGSTAPLLAAAETGRIAEMQYPVASASLVYDVIDNSYSIRALPAAGGAPVTVLATSQNKGHFEATASAVYYDAANLTTSPGQSVTSGTVSGILGLDGTVLQAPLANSTFLIGAETAAYPDSTPPTTETARETVFQIQNLAPVTVTDPVTGQVITGDGVSGGTLVAIDTTTNQPVATLGTVGGGNALNLVGSFNDDGHVGFVTATTALSTASPATRDLYLLNSHLGSSLVQETNNL